MVSHRWGIERQRSPKDRCLSPSPTRARSAVARTAPDLVCSGGYTLRPRAEAGVSGLSSAERFRSEAFFLPSPSRKGGQHMGGASAPRPVEFFWGILKKGVQKQLLLSEEILLWGSGFGTCKISESRSRIKVPPPPQISIP